MDRSSREYRNHPVRAILNRASSGFAIPDEDELRELHVPDAVRDKVRATASILYDAARTGGMRGKHHARRLAEDHTADLIASIPQTYRHAVRPEPVDTDPRTNTQLGDAVLARAAHRDLEPHSESIDQRIRRRGA